MTTSLDALLALLNSTADHRNLECETLLIEQDKLAAT